MDEYKILICYRGGQTFIGCAEKSEQNSIILKDPRVLIQWRNEEGEPGLFFEFVIGFPKEITFFQVDAFWIPSKMVATWYIEETSELSIAQTVSKNQLLS